MSTVGVGVASSLILAASDGRATVTRLADELGLRQPTVSHHAKALLERGILARAPEGRQVWYIVAPDQIDRVTVVPDTAHQAGHRPSTSPNG